LCSAGKYSSTVGANSSSFCLNCAVGSYSSSGSSEWFFFIKFFYQFFLFNSKIKNSTPCDAGMSSQTGSSGCLPCSAGSFSSAGSAWYFLFFFYFLFFIFYFLFYNLKNKNNKIKIVNIAHLEVTLKVKVL
jgi:hypothetical protein